MKRKWSQVGNNIKTIREARRVQQKELAEDLGISVRTLQHIENGEQDIAYSRLIEIAGRFTMSVSSLVELHEQPIPYSANEKKMPEGSLVSEGSLANKIYEEHIKDLRIAITHHIEVEKMMQEKIDLLEIKLSNCMNSLPKP